MIRIEKLQHCGLVVHDLEKSRWFYGTVLGMEELSRPRTFTFRGAWFRSGDGEVHLIAAGDTTAPPGLEDPGPGKHAGLATHIAFEVDDLAATRAQLIRHGVEILGGPVERGDGFEQLWVFDPDGYVIEFFQRTDTDQRAAPERGAVRG